MEHLYKSIENFLGASGTNLKATVISDGPVKKKQFLDPIQHYFLCEIKNKNLSQPFVIVIRNMESTGLNILRYYSRQDYAEEYCRSILTLGESMKTLKSGPHY